MNADGITVVKAFNTMNYVHLRDEGRPPGTPGRLAPEAKALDSRLIDEVGFDPVDTGSLAEGGQRQQPGSPLFNQPLTAEEARAEISKEAA